MSIFVVKLSESKYLIAAHKALYEGETAVENVVTETAGVDETRKQT